MSSGGDGIGYDGRYVDANEGNACGRGISVCQYAMAGENDDSLKCPVNVKFIMELVNQAEEKNKELSEYVEWHRPKSQVLGTIWSVCLYSLDTYSTHIIIIIDHFKFNNFLVL